jgi:hypothetical protein
VHGVPKDLDLTPFLNAMLERVDFGIHIFHLRFDKPGTEISVEGFWELRDSTGNVIDSTSDDPDGCVRLPLLTGKTVVSTAIDPPRSISLQFDSGHTLVLFDDSEYESFSIRPGNWFI